MSVDRGQCAAPTALSKRNIRMADRASLQRDFDLAHVWRAQCDGVDGKWFAKFMTNGGFNLLHGTSLMLCPMLTVCGQS